jgi:hypothetical protein
MSVNPIFVEDSPASGAVLTGQDYQQRSDHQRKNH